MPISSKPKLDGKAPSPWNDRMDPRAAIAILSLANTATALDSAPRDSIDHALTGLATGYTEISLKSASGGQRRPFPPRTPHPHTQHH